MLRVRTSIVEYYNKRKKVCQYLSQSGKKYTVGQEVSSHSTPLAVNSPPLAVNSPPLAVNSTALAVNSPAQVVNSPPLKEAEYQQAGHGPSTLLCAFKTESL